MERNKKSLKRLKKCCFKAWDLGLIEDLHFDQLYKSYIYTCIDILLSCMYFPTRVTKNLTIIIVRTAVVIAICVAERSHERAVTFAFFCYEYLYVHLDCQKIIKFAK